MQKPILRRNGLREVTIRVDYCLDLRKLAILLLRYSFNTEYSQPIKSQKEFEQKIRYYIYCNGVIDEDFEHNCTEEQLNKVMDMIRKLYPNYEW